MASQVLDINVPEVTPQGPVNTSENIPSTPGMFGGFGAQAAEKAGQGIETAADTGLDVMTAKAHLTNEIHAGELNSWLADKLTDEYSNFSQLRGRAAQEALPQFKQRIEDLRKQSIGQAGNLQTQALVSNANRFLADKFYSYGTGHADKEFRVWADQTVKDRASNYAGVAAIAAQHGDFNGLETALGTSDDEVRKLYEQSAGDYGATGDPDFIDRNVKNNRSHNLRTIIETQADTDPGMAAMVYKKYKDQLLPQDQLTTLNKLKTQSVKIDAIDRVDGMMGKTSSPMDIAEKQIGLNEVKDRGTIAAFIHNVGGQNVDPALTPWCFTGDTEILTENGFVRLDSIPDGSIVYQADTDGNLSLTKSKKIEKDYDGDVFDIKHRYFNITCDVGHRWYGVWRKDNSPEFRTLDKITTYGLYIPRVHSQAHGLSITYNEIALVAAFMADGKNRNSDNGKAWSIEFEVSRTRKVEYLTFLSPAHVYKQKRAYGPLTKTPLTVFRFLVPECFYLAFDSYKKLSRTFINGLSRDQARHFLRIYAKFDGNDSETHPCIYTSENHIKDAITEIAILAGYHVSARKRSPGGISIKDSWMVSFSPLKKSRYISRDEISRRRFVGRLYCVTVPESRIVIRSPDGTAMLTGNCASWANAVLKSAGYQGTNSAAARSFLNYGQPVSQPTRGDIVVLSRGNDPSKGHVGFYEGPGSTPGTVRILGGNQNDSVSVSEFPEASVIGYRRIGAGDVPRTPPVGPGPSVFVQQSKGDAMQQILDDPELKQNPQLRDAMLTELNKRYTAQQVDFLNQERMEKVKETKQKNDYKAATDELLTGMQKDDPSWDAQRIMSDPRFAYNREHALGLLQSKVSGNADAATYGKDFYSLFKRIHAPQDDPSRITDQDALNAHLGSGGLTLSGLKQLRQEISEKGTAQGDADGAMKKTFLANAHRQISGHDPLLHLQDPKGEEQYLKFLASFFPAYDKGIKDGKTPSQLLNPESPDYLGKSVGQFKRSPAQQYADQWAANVPGEGTIAPAAFDEKTATPQQLISMVHNNQISRAEAERIALSKGWIRANPAPQPNVQVPTSQ